jgi:hypothetical protein
MSAINPLDLEYIVYIARAWRSSIEPKNKSLERPIEYRSTIEQKSVKNSKKQKAV